jgi:prepilin-type N-terminal cleavage/methylation domain-containing protein
MIMRQKILRQAGFTVLEVMISLAILTVGILAAFALNSASVAQVVQARQRSLARLAVITARMAFETQRFRKQTPTDVTYFLYGKGGAGTSTYPIAWNANGSAFQMLDCTGTPAAFTITGTNGTSGATNPYRATVDGVSGCLCLEFPVPPLVAPAGRLYPGRVVFYLSEAGQPATIPTAAFPFPPTPGLTGLDCDGDGALTTGDLRAGDLTAAHPFKLIPVKITVDWQEGQTGGKVESYTEWDLLCYHGHD